VVFIIAIVVVIAVIGFGIAVAKGQSYTAAETNLLAQVAASRVAWMVNLSLALNWLFSPPIAAIVGVLSAAIVLLATRRWVAVLHFVLLVAGTWLGSEVVKLIVHRPRPTAALADTLVPNPDPDSYPSGHVCFAVALGFGFVILATRSAVRVILVIAAIALSLVTAATRVYLGIHFPTDAIASLVYSAAAFVGIEALWRRYAGMIFRRP
jgi:undecaprenyl-diphosphatase